MTVKAIALVGLGILATWMVASAHYERTLTVLILYLGLLDGYLKLKTGSRIATLGRDVLLYAIVAGASIRFFISRTRVQRPAFAGWVLALVMLGVVEILNPGTGGVTRGLAAVRPHIEFVPLFFLGWITMRSRRRLRAFLFLLLFVAAANGVVGLVQFNDTPAQLAAWGPGYSADILGTNGVAGRVFVDSSGKSRVRPFGLGADAGDGGILGALAVGASLSLLVTRRGRKRHAEAAILLVLAAGTVLAVLTSQTRIAVVGAAVAIVAFCILSAVRIDARRFVALIGGLILAAVLAVVVIDVVVASAPGTSGAFRYSSIAPNRVVSTTISHKGAALAQFPTLAFHYPFGAGLGSVGPAAGFDRGTGQGDPLDGETEPDFLVVELGVAGVVIFYGLQLSLMVASIVMIRRVRDSELRLLLAAVAAPIFALFVMGVSGPVSSGSPGSPYYWFAGGTLAWWISATRGARLGPSTRPSSTRSRGPHRERLPTGITTS